jgi:hypothetical protein
VLQVIQRGEFESGLDHYRKAGAKEGRNGGFSGWDEEMYLFANDDVRDEVKKGTFTSGLDHYYRAGAAEGRPIWTYQETILPDRHKIDIKGAPHDWNDQAYLNANPDVARLVAERKFPNGYAHYIQIGFLEGLASGFPSWNERAYLDGNPDVVKAIASGDFTSGFDHYLKVGHAQGRLRRPMPRWIEGSYLWRNGDVVQAIRRGEFESGLDHYRKWGVKEGRIGGFSGWDEEAIFLRMTM